MKNRREYMENDSLEVILYVVRHGQTIFNALNKMQGWSDTPLTTEGAEDIKSLGRGLKDIDFTAAYSSDLGRTIRTAQIILSEKGQDDLNIIELENLRESCFGIYEGMPGDEAWEDAAKKSGYHSFQDMLKERSHQTVGKMLNAIVKADTSNLAEDIHTVRSRVTKQLTDLTEATKRNGGGNILVVSHGVSIMSFVTGLIEAPIPKDGLHNGSVTKVRYQNGQFMIEEFNEIKYIEAGRDALVGSSGR